MKKTWQAEFYPQFMNMTIKELNQFVGINRLSDLSDKSIKNNFGEIFRFKKDDGKEQHKLSIEQLPTNFDWKKHLKPTESQGGCGSCYAYAAMRMLEARIKIKYNDDVKLSVQHNLDCSYYNQGCKGGYSYLVLKFAKDFELVPESCHPYKAEIGKCSDSCDTNKLDFPYTVENYSYLGGAYGRSNELLMMEELYKNGPFVVSIEPDYNFVYYKSGIYSGVKDDTWIKTGVLTPPEWRKVDHSVLLVGWGYDEKLKEKYWLIQNSWGSNWGDEGFFKIKRGTDELHVESMAEVATPGIKKKKIF
jgi:cathepsin C